MVASRELLEKMNIEAAVEIAMKGGKLIDIAAALGCSLPTYFRLKENHADFAQKMESARLQGYENLLEGFLTILEDNPLLSTEELKIKSDGVKFYLAKICPQKYSDRMTVAVEKVDIIGALNESRARAARAIPVLPKILDIDPFEE